MTPSEGRLLEAFLRNADNFVEFGSGGSTVLAANLVRKSIHSVDSSMVWQQKVSDACLALQTRLTPKLLYVDIGPVGDWGYPTDSRNAQKWPRYFENIWQTHDISDDSLYLVDGRFRVSCFMAILARCRGDNIILIHDYSDRPHYHVIADVAREIASAERLSAFIPQREMQPDKINTILAEHRFDPR